MLFPILIIRFYAIGFIDGDPDFFMFNCAMESENEFKAILCCHVVKPPNITIVTFTSLKNLIGNLPSIILNCNQQTEASISDCITPYYESYLMAGIFINYSSNPNGLRVNSS